MPTACFNYATGNDTTGTGSDLNPYKTTTKANNSGFAQYEILFARGVTWPPGEPTISPASGVAGTPTRLGAYGDAGLALPLFDLGDAANHSLNLQARHDVEARDLDLYNAGKHGIYMGSSAHDILLENLRIRNCGSVAAGLGNGIEVWESNYNIVARNNYITECYDEGMTIQGNATTTVSDISFYGNIIEKCLMGISWYEYGVNSVCTRIKIANNICWDNGNPTIFHLNHPCALYSGGFADTSTLTDCLIEDNIFHTVKATYPMVCWKIDAAGRYTDIPAGLTLDRNCYYDATWGTGQMFWGNSSGSLKYDLAAWRTRITGDDNSIITNPSVVSVGNDYHLQAGSPCIGAGVILAGINNFNDIGKYAYVAPPVAGSSILRPQRGIW